MNPKTIDDHLRLQGLNSRSAADRAGLSRVSLWRWTTGRSIPRNEQLGSLATLLQLPVSDVLELIAAARERHARRARRDRQQRRATQARSHATAPSRHRRHKRSTPAKGTT